MSEWERTPAQVAENLRKVRELLGENGERWTRKELTRNVGGVEKYCALGGINQILYGRARGKKPRPDFRGILYPIGPEVDALRYAADRLKGGGFSWMFQDDQSIVTEFNDWHIKTPAQLREWFALAEKIALAEETTPDRTEELTK